MFSVRLDPQPGPQDEETLIVTTDGREQSMRLHESDRVYSIPGLYDEVLRRLEYASPGKVAQLLFAAPGVEPSSSGRSTSRPATAYRPTHCWRAGSAAWWGWT